MVFDLNKCIGCQTCSVACKMPWTRDDDRQDGTDYMWWCSVNTMPGRGYPKNWEQMGGGYRDGVLQRRVLPSREDFGGGWDFNYEEVYYGGKGTSAHLQPVGEEPTWGPSWDEDLASSSGSIGLEASVPAGALPVVRLRGHLLVVQPAWLAPSAAGVLAVVFLVGLYLGLVSWAQGFGHARGLLWEDRYFVGAIAGGFGLQVALFVYGRKLLARATAGSAAGVTAAGTGTSTVAMVACCAHHVADALPLIGLSGAAIFLNDYRIPLMATGLAVNAVGIGVMLRLVMAPSRRAREG